MREPPRGPVFVYRVYLILADRARLLLETSSTARREISAENGFREHRRVRLKRALVTVPAQTSDSVEVDLNGLTPCRHSRRLPSVRAQEFGPKGAHWEWSHDVPLFLRTHEREQDQDVCIIQVASGVPLSLTGNRRAEGAEIFAIDAWRSARGVFREASALISTRAELQTL